MGHSRDLGSFDCGSLACLAALNSFTILKTGSTTNDETPQPVSTFLWAGEFMVPELC